MNLQLIKIPSFFFSVFFVGSLRVVRLVTRVQWCSQFNENGTANAGGGGGGSGAGGKSQIQIRLIVPASQCGSLIGK